MLLMSDENGEIVVYDPNETPEKTQYQQHFSDEKNMQEGINYWVYRR